MHPFGQAVKCNIGNVDRCFLALLFTIQDVSEVSFVLAVGLEEKGLTFDFWRKHAIVPSIYR